MLSTDEHKRDLTAAASALDVGMIYPAPGEEFDAQEEDRESALCIGEVGPSFPSREAAESFVAWVEGRSGLAWSQQPEEMLERLAGLWARDGGVKMQHNLDRYYDSDVPTMQLVKRRSHAREMEGQGWPRDLPTT